MAEVQLKSVSKRFGKHPLLQNLSLDIQSGEYIGLLGPSGCGKTTLLKIIAGLVAADSGDVLLAGKRVNEIAPRKRDVSLVFQNDALYPHLTVNESIRMSLGGLPAAEQRARINEACQITHASDLLDRRPDNLSGGELRRAAITKAVARRASVRLLDEPLSALDAHIRHSIQSALLQWHTATPGTTIHVTHDGQEAARVADRIAVIEQSQDGLCNVIQFDRPEVIYRRPQSKSVAMLVGSPPMTLLPAKLHNSALVFGSDRIRPTASIELLESVETEIEVGFRSDAIQHVDSRFDQNVAGLFLSGRFGRTQFVNGKTLTTIDLGNAELLLDVPVGSSPANGASDCEVFIASSELHFFGAASGLRLSSHSG